MIFFTRDHICLSIFHAIPLLCPLFQYRPAAVNSVSSPQLRHLTAHGEGPTSRQTEAANGATGNEEPCWTLRWRQGQLMALWLRENCSTVSRTWTHIRYITGTASRLRPDRTQAQKRLYHDANCCFTIKKNKLNLFLVLYKKAVGRK